MKLPKPTEQYPYIFFSFTKRGNLKLRLAPKFNVCNKWGCIMIGGEVGNIAPPDKVGEWIKFFKEARIKQIDKQIALLNKDKAWYKNLKGIK